MGMRTLWRVLPALALLCCLPSLGFGQSIFVDLLRPVSDDLGRYMAVNSAGSYPIMGVVASQQPVTRVTVGGVEALVFPVNYGVFGAPASFPVYGFRARVFVEPFTPLRVTVVDAEGNFRDASYLPDRPNTLQRIQFLLQQLPGDPFTQLRMANANAQAGNLDLALPMFDTFVDNNPDFGIGRHLRGLTLLDYGRVDDGVADLQWLTDNVPEAVVPRLDLAEAQHEVGDYQPALANYQEVLLLRPDSAETHLLMGQAVRESGGMLPQALELQGQALEQDPTLSDAHYEVGLNHAQRGEYNEALASMQQSVQDNPRNAQAHLAMAQLRYQRRDYRRAWKEMRRAVRWGAVPDPDFVRALNAAMPEPLDVAPPYNFRRPL